MTPATPETPRSAPPRSSIARLRSLVLRYPDDPEVRSVYGDVLAETGDPRGRFIRAQSSLEGKLPPSAREAAKHEVRTLLDAHEKEWKEIASWAEVRFKGGFIHAIRAPIGAFLANAAALFAVEPVRKVLLMNVSDADLAQLAEHEALGRIGHLGLLGPFEDAGATAFAKSRHVSTLRALNLGGGVGEGFASALGGFSALESLSLSGLDIGDETMALFAKAQLPRLQRFYAARNGLSDEGVAALAEATSWTSLSWLCLGGNEFSDEGAQALAKAKFGCVTHLELNQTGVGDEGMLAILGGKAFRSLKRVDLTMTGVTGEAIKKLRAKKITVVGYG